MKHLFSRFKDTYFGNNLNLRIRMFNVLAMAGILLSLYSAVIAISRSIVVMLVSLCAAFFSFGFLQYATRTKKYQRCYIITVIIIFLGLFPILFFSAGGYDGSKVFMLMLAVIFTIFMLRGKSALIWAGIEILVYVILFVTAYLRPEMVHTFSNERIRLYDIVFGFVLNSAAFGICIFIILRLYDKQQKTLAEQNVSLEKLSNLKTEFLGNAAHELKTPLTSISGFAQYSDIVLKSKTLQDSDIVELRENVEWIMQVSDRMKRIIDQLLDVAKIEQCGFMLCKKAVSVAEISAQVKTIHFPNMEKNNNKLTILEGHNTPAVYADFERILQVILNLVTNANRYTKDGLIKIAFKQDGAKLNISVSDNGEGIQPELLPNLFERYTQSKPGLVSGTGLGLYICKQIVEAHGEKIWIESTVGLGTTVTFTLPLSE